MLFFHIYYQYSYICGITFQIKNIVENTFSLDAHVIVTFDGQSNTKEYIKVKGKNIIRFPSVSNEELINFENLNTNFNNTFKEFIEYVRKAKPNCIILYVWGPLLNFILKVLPEQRFIFIPYVFLEDIWNEPVSKIESKL